MICEQCGGNFPKKQGRFCGTCGRGPQPVQRDPLLLAVASVLRDLVQENAHILVGGISFAADSIARLEAAFEERPDAK